MCTKVSEMERNKIVDLNQLPVLQVDKTRDQVETIRVTILYCRSIEY